MRKSQFGLSLFFVLAGFGCSFAAGAENIWAFSSHPCTVTAVVVGDLRFDRLGASTGGYYYAGDVDYGMTDMSIGSADGFDSIVAQDEPGYRFLGWYTKADGWANATNPTVASATSQLTSSKTLTWTLLSAAGGRYPAGLQQPGRLTVVARYIPVYDVATDVSPAGAGTATGDGTYDEGANVSLKATPAAGYLLKEWTKDGAPVSPTNFSFAASAGSAGVYTAVFTGKVYQVSLKKNNGEGGLTSVLATYGSPMPKLDTLPSRYGYDFAGYFTSTADDATQYYDGKGESVRNWDQAGSGSLWEQWTPQMGSLHLKISEGIAAICYRTGELANWTTNTANATVQLQVGTRVTAYAIPAADHRVDYHVENKWEGTVPKDGITFAPTATEVVVVRHTVTFADPTWTNAAVEVQTVDGEAATAPDWSRAGYTLGWDGDFSVVTSNQTVNAVWSGNAFTVRFNAAGGTGAMPDQPFAYGTPAALTPNAFVRTGYRFDGWATVPGGAAAFADGETVSNLTTVAGGVVDLFARWSGSLVNPYSVAADCAMSSGNVIALELAADTVVNSPPEDVGEDGCLVVTDADGAAPGGNEQYIKLTVPEEARDEVFSFSKLSFKVPCAGTLTFCYKVVRVNYQDKIENYFVVYTNAFSASEYVYDTGSGWTQFPSIPLAAGDVVDLRFQSLYREDSYALVDKIEFLADADEPVVSFDPNGGSLAAASATRTVTNGCAVGELPTPAWDGHSFDGWFTAQAGGEEVTAETVVTNDVTFYAQWTETPAPPDPPEPPEPEPTIVTNTPGPLAFQEITRVSTLEWRLVITNRTAKCEYALACTDDLAAGFTTTGAWERAEADGPWTTNVIFSAEEAKPVFFWKALGRETYDIIDP